MKYIKFDVESNEIQEMLRTIAATSQIGIALGKNYKNDVAHLENDLAFSAVLVAHTTAMDFIAAILNKEDVSFEDLIKEIET